MELRQFAIDLKTQVEKIAPSLIKHLDLSELETEYYPASFSGRVSEKDVALLHWSKDADNLALTNLYFSSEGVSWMEAQEKIKAMIFSQKKDFLKQQLHNLNCHQSLPRAFEVAEFGFQITLSSSAYAQLKRHRITTQIPRPYCKELGYTIPPSIEQLGLSEDFRRVIERTQDLYTRIYAINPLCASYVLTNAHRRVVYLKTNLRELYHISRLRMDASAQWDIRVIVSKMIELAQEKAPLTLALAGGKDEFEQIKKKFMED
jgi:thymidylate synthase ThyX